jgi:hypothetical protein
VVGLVLLLLAAPETVETPHYRLVSEGPRAEAEEFGRLLEAAYPAFAAYFKAAPKLKKGERLAVRFFETREAWAAALREAGATVPDGAGGMYWEPDRTAYVYRQPTRLFTRAVLLHEATHQFHFLARTRNRSPSAYWYREGVAECLGWHHWDGETLALGVLPTVALEDYPAQALRELRDPALDLEAVVEGRAEGSRPVAWAIYRHLATGNKGKPLGGFERLAGRLDGGAKATGFWKSFGQPAAYKKALVTWLEAEQQPFVPVFNEWEGLGADRVRGFAKVVSLCRLQRAAARFAATIEAPAAGAWQAGGILHFAGPEDYAIFLVNASGGLRVQRRTEGRWEMLEGGAGPGAAATHEFEVTARGKSVTLSLGGREYGPWEVTAPAFGLALDGSEVVFSGLRWE